MATLVRWLGPWADGNSAPGAVSRRSIQVPATAVAGATAESFEAWLYAPTAAPITGAYAVAPGLHFLGPRDTRMDRFCRILAASGCLVISPFIADFMGLRVTARAIQDYRASIRALQAAPEYPRGRRPWLFSISFGSLLALRAATAPDLRDDIGGAVLFGGYADWRAVMNFCLTGLLPDGRPAEHFDPLNRPVVFLTLLDTVLECADVAPEYGPNLAAAWLELARRTWSRPGEPRDDRARARLHRRVAGQLAAELPESTRALYLMGCGLDHGGIELAQRALERFDSDYMDVISHLPGLRCPVHVAHGVEDDVIPVQHAHALASALPAGLDHGLYITGLYGHTAHGSLIGLMPALGREVSTLAGLVRAIASA